VAEETKLAQNGAALAKTFMRWFLVSGSIGLFVALILSAVPVVSPVVLLVLWPSSIAGLVDPSRLWDQVIVAAVQFGGNFIIYGLIGAFIGLRLHVRGTRLWMR
jgi:hypothetical protein